MKVACTRVLFLCVMVAWGGPSPGQDTPPPKQKRSMYLVRHRDAKELAAVLSKHFKEEAEIQVLPASDGKYLLLRAEPDRVAEILSVLERVDQPPQLVVVDVLLVEVPAKAPAEGKGLDEKELTGASQTVLARVEALRRGGSLNVLKQMRFTAVDNQPLSLQLGESTPYVTGVMAAPSGRTSRMVQQQSTGMTAMVTAHVRGQAVALDLKLNDSRLTIPPNGVELGKDENGNILRAPVITQASWNTTLLIPSGQAVTLLNSKTDAKGDTQRILLIASVRLLPSGSPSGREP